MRMPMNGQMRNRLRSALATKTIGTGNVINLHEFFQCNFHLIARALGGPDARLHGHRRA
jgi:hypothetical protein